MCVTCTQCLPGNKIFIMKKADKLRHERYIISMKIIDLESREKRMKLTKNESSELAILREKVNQLDQRLSEIGE
jgi:hypothetical protein